MQVEHLKKFYSVSEISKMYGFTQKAVRELCHSRGSNFAFKIKENGRFYIDAKKFKEHIERKRRKGA